MPNQPPNQQEGVQRFAFGPDNWPGGSWRLRANEDGDWVRFEDYQHLQAQRDEWHETARRERKRVQRAEQRLIGAREELGRRIEQAELAGTREEVELLQEVSKLLSNQEGDDT